MDQRRRRRRRGRRQTRRRRKRNLLLKMIILIILIVGTIAALLLWKKYGPSKETADLNKYYGVENDNQLAIVVNNQIIDPKGMITDGKAYVEYSVVRDYINERFYWDPNENTLLIYIAEWSSSCWRGKQGLFCWKREEQRRVCHCKD